MAEYEHGKMNVEEQEKTFAGFIRWSAWSCCLIAVVLIFLALTQT